MTKQQIDYMGTPKTKKYEPDGWDMFDDLPMQYIGSKYRSTIHKDDHFCIYCLLALLLFMVVTLSIIVTREIGFVQHNLEEHLLEDIQITPIPTVIPTSIPAVIPTVTAQPTRAVKALASRGGSIGLLLPKGSDGSFKALMPISSITLESSKQWNLKQIYDVDSDGFAKIGDYYVIAIGQAYSNHIGDTFIITIGGETLKFIIGDVKRTEDTINSQYCKKNGSIIEFIVDSEIMTHEKLQALMPGRVIKILKEDLK